MAKSLAQAYANAIGRGCGGKEVDVQSAAVAEAFAKAVATAQGAVAQDGAGSTMAAATAFSQVSSFQYYHISL